MMKTGAKDIRISDYMYDLPQERIARYPLPDRDRSRLLLYDGDNIEDRSFFELPELLDRETLVIFNNTRVIMARLIFVKKSGARIEVFCLEPLVPHEFAQSFSSGPGVEWKCLIGNVKRWKDEILTSFFRIRETDYRLTVTRQPLNDGTFRVRFSWDDSAITFGEILDAAGHVPIPPYLEREDEESDKSNYQTLFASVNGSVAAPTAGLHFTPSLMERIKDKGIETAEVTLHVSAGTFRPVKSELISGHLMHNEHFFVSRETIKRLMGRKILAVGTTTVRTLESIYWLGADISAGMDPSADALSVSQWQPYRNTSDPDKDHALEELLKWMDKKGLNQIEAQTEIIIVPGYKFHVVTEIITNFHQPGSTLLLLVGAYTGKKWKAVYDHALAGGYRFLSYGDSMLLRDMNNQ